ncbi:MAG: division/cell wall cluster transcriptional repressor MraZ [Clostridiales bacterium]|nr:division/cell wall cluster transcriptional repressor MraZ [Clostridiales bacterium]
MFIGQYHHQMDDKGRLRIPPAFRRQLGDNPMVFCGFVDNERCLCVYPREDFDRLVIERFKNADMLDMDMNDIKRAIFSSTQELVEDKQGRVSLNSSFIEDCGLTKDLITIGAYDRVEIWDEEVYKEHKKKTDFNKIIAQFTGSRNKI